MKIMNTVRYVFQVALLAVFSYQMVLAIGKYFSFATTTVEETKDIKDARLPSIFVCAGEQIYADKARFREHGYIYGLDDYLPGSLDMKDDVLTWEGKQNLTYEIITKQMFPNITSENLSTMGNPYYNWKKAKDLRVHVTALNGFCKQIDLNMTNLASSDMFFG